MEEKPQFQTLNFYLVISGLILASVVIVTTIVISSIVWLPLLVFLSPTLLISFLLIKYTPIGNPVKNQFEKIYDWFLYQSEGPRKVIWGFIYNAIIILYPQTNWKTMNYGYAILNREGKLIKNLKEEDEDERFCLQLYHFVATKFNKLKDLTGLSVIDIGTGRGGGLNYVSQYLNPKKCVGIDLSENQIRFCKTQYKKNKNIQFFQEDSEKLDEIKGIQGEQFDILLNIESSHCYGNLEQFLDKSATIVKQGGNMLLADFRSQEGYQQLKQSIEDNEYWEIENEEDITLNVVKSLKLDENRKTTIIEENINSYLQPFFRKFSGLEGSKINKEFQERKTIYIAFVLKRK